MLVLVVMVVMVLVVMMTATTAVVTSAVTGAVAVDQRTVVPLLLLLLLLQCHDSCVPCRVYTKTDRQAHELIELINHGRRERVFDLTCLLEVVRPAVKARQRQLLSSNKNKHVYDEHGSAGGGGGGGG